MCYLSIFVTICAVISASRRNSTYMNHESGYCFVYQFMYVLHGFIQGDHYQGWIQGSLQGASLKQRKLRVGGLAACSTLSASVSQWRARALFWICQWPLHPALLQNVTSGDKLTWRLLNQQKYVSSNYTLLQHPPKILLIPGARTSICEYLYRLSVLPYVTFSGQQASMPQNEHTD